MSFEIPRLRVKCAQILQRYRTYLKSPVPFFKELLADLEQVDLDLYVKCKDLISAASQITPPITVLDAFIDDFKLFLSKNSPTSLSTLDEGLLNKSVSNLHGVGAKTQTALEDFEIATVKDIIFTLPFRYEIISTEPTSEKYVLSGIYINSAVIRTRQGKQMLQVHFKGDTGVFTGIWLHFNKQFPLAQLNNEKKHALYGSVTGYKGIPAIFHPELLEDYEIGGVRNVYSVPAKLSQKIYYKAVQHALEEYLPYVGETLPDSILFRHRYPEIKDALNTIHEPKTAINAHQIMNREHPAIQRLIYEELFYLQLRLLLRKSNYSTLKGIQFDIPKTTLDEITPLMPFRLTDGQRNALREVLTDMKSTKQMNRLLQGDVGSGKTIIAFICGLIAVKNGYQTVLLAPTEILAEQHYKNLEKFLGKSGYRACLLTGSLKTKDKKAVKEAIAANDVHFVVGTHAVIQEDVVFNNLGFAIIDEQHRFGVKQRKILMDKGFTPDILLMTATPIPRTLALTFYGDLEISEIEGMPPGRIPPLTKVFREDHLSAAFNFVAENLKKDERAYFIYPAIDSEKGNLKSVNKNVEIIRKYFKDKTVGLLHGKIKAEEKSSILDAFQKGSIDILVSTTVVEVGVDVRDATIILIENADRFGLAQLHQLRGRVGRNDKQSHCVLVASPEVSDIGFRRLRAMEQHNSGFKLAELDLQLRGHGDFFGIKQSGMPEFRYADILKDGEILKEARRQAEELIDEDPQLSLPKSSLIRSVLMQRWQDDYELFLVG